MMSDLGTEVTILEALPKILPGCDKDVADVVVRSFKKRGIAIRTGVPVTGHTPTRRARRPRSPSATARRSTVDLVVVSVGRRPFPDLLGLDGTGVEVDERGFVQVDEPAAPPRRGCTPSATSSPPRSWPTSASPRASWSIKRHPRRGSPVPVDYERVPWAIYCHPEVAFAGHSEEPAEEEGFDVVTSKHRYVGNGRAMIIGETDGLVKVIAEKRPDGTGGRILGVHMVGPVGHRAARPGLPGRQLGGHRRRGRRTSSSPTRRSASCSANRCCPSPAARCTEPIRAAGPDDAPTPHRRGSRRPWPTS